MYLTKLYRFWNTIPSLKIPSNCGFNITEDVSYNWTRQNWQNANLTFKTLQNPQNAQNTFFTFCWWHGRVVDKKPRDGGWRWVQYGGYKWIWEIRGPTCLIGLGTPHIGVITHQIGTHTCCIGDGKLTCTRNSLKSQFLRTISPISSHLYLSRLQLYHHLRTWR